MKTAQLPTGEMAPSSWPWQEPYRFNLNDGGVPVADLSMTPVSIHPDGGNPDSTLQDYGKNPAGEKEVQFRLTRVTLEPMLRSMTYISQQLSAPANRVAVINLKL
ncbi:unnamed protein product [Malus baccata var. baccata]